MYTPRTIALNYFINVSYATFKTVYLDSRRSPSQEMFNFKQLFFS